MGWGASTWGVSKWGVEDPITASGTAWNKDWSKTYGADVPKPVEPKKPKVLRTKISAQQVVEDREINIPGLTDFLGTVKTEFHVKQRATAQKLSRKAKKKAKRRKAKAMKILMLAG